MRSAARAPSTAGAASPRVALARLALEAALEVRDIVAGEAGERGPRVTADPAAGLLRGVSVTAERDGRYAVDLRLVARMTPLMPLGDAVRRRVQASAQRHGLADQVGTVNIEFARVLAADEPEPAADTRRLDAGGSAPPPPAVSDVPPAAAPPGTGTDDGVRR